MRPFCLSTAGSATMAFDRFAPAGTALTVTGAVMILLAGIWKAYDQRHAATSHSDS